MRTAISADLDGEELPVTRAALTRHVAGCPACREFQARAAALNPQVRLAPAPRVPDLTSRVLAVLEEEPEPAAAAATTGLRLGLAIIGAIQLGLSLPALLLGSDAGLPVHQARHLGSFGVALAIGLLVAAWRPARISGLLPLAIALVVCLVGSAVADVATGHAAATSELTHLVEILGLLGLWLLDHVQRWPQPAALHAI